MSARPGTGTRSVVIRRLRGAMLIAAVCAVPGRVLAQDTPEQVAEAYVGHLTRGEMRQAGALVHPTALARRAGAEWRRTPAPPPPAARKRHADGDAGAR